MTIIELVKTAKCKRKDILNKYDFILAYTIFRVLLQGEDEIPSIGSAKIKKIDGKSYMIIELDQKWQDLINDKNVKQILIDKVKDKIDEL